MKAYDYYLFDADGTLFDTTDLICNCFDFVSQKFTGKKTDQNAVITTIGLPLREMLAIHLGQEHDLELVLDTYVQYQLAIMAEYVGVFPGVTETLQTLRKHGKKLALVTSRRRISLDVILNATDTGRFFDCLITPEDTTRHKPHAAPALKAMELLEANRATTVFAGDAQYDICSGASAGVDTVFVNWSRMSASSLPVTPTWTIDSITELVAPLK
jgi:pyrophosphatase PpaX